MPWCPKCRRFQEEDDLCAHCWVEVVDTLPPEPPDLGEEVLLVSVGDENEANFIQNLLESNGIYSLRRYKESGGYLKVYMNMAVFGIDIYVNETDLETAREILQAQITDDEDITKEDPGYVEDKITGRQNVARIMIAVILIPFLAGVIISIIDAIMKLLR